MRERFGVEPRSRWSRTASISTTSGRSATWTATRRSVLFLGSLDWRPNLDAVALLLDDIFPQVRAQVPAATLSLVGRHPPDWLQARVAATPGVRVLADVPDVRPFLATCGMLVVPLRIGGGSRLKILEALATETPVVSTRVGAEGLQLTPGPRPDRDRRRRPRWPRAIVEAIRRPDETAGDGRERPAARAGPLLVGPARRPARRGVAVRRPRRAACALRRNVVAAIALHCRDRCHGDL